MPLIAYLRAHGANDYPLHFAFFEQCQKRGLLDKYDFALDPIHDRVYCEALKARFPQLKMVEEVSTARVLFQYAAKSIKRYYGPLGYLDKFDAVCEGCGGHLHGHYMKQNPFRHYQRTKKRALLFQSIEDNALLYPEVSRAVADADIVIARTEASAKRAASTGAKRVVESSDIVFAHEINEPTKKPGIAAALRLPNALYGRPMADSDYVLRVREIFHYLDGSGVPIDYVRIEPPLDSEMMQKGYGSEGRFPHISVYHR